MAKDWFRKTTWTDDDRADFDQRLQRARPYNKAQYLRIQAVTLIATDPTFARSAIALLDRLFAEYPEKGQLAAAYTAKAEAFAKLGEIETALEHYWAAIEQMRIFPNAKTTAHIELAFLAAQTRQTHWYDRAFEALAEHEAQKILTFAVNLFMTAAARAFIFYDRRQYPEAVKQAQAALEAASFTHSGLRYHANVGLVGTEHAREIMRLKALIRAIIGSGFVGSTVIHKWLYDWQYRRR